MTINSEQIQALKAAAEKATPGDWWIDSHGSTMVSFSDKDDMEVIFVTDGLKMGPAIRHESTGNLSHWRNDNDATFIATANPAVILSLLAERDADKALIAELKPIAAHAQRGWKEAHEQEALVEQAMTRIAELEARTLTVKLPQPEQWSICEVLLDKKKVIAAIRESCAVAGITLDVGE